MSRRLVLPFVAVPLPSVSVWARLRSEVEAALGRHGRVPTLLFAGTDTHRLAALNGDLAPGSLGAAEAELISRPAARWTAVVGEVLGSGTDRLRRVALRVRWAHGGFVAWTRAFRATERGPEWHGDWEEQEGPPGLPPPAELAALFPSPQRGLDVVLLPLLRRLEAQHQFAVGPLASPGEVVAAAARFVAARAAASPLVAPMVWRHGPDGLGVRVLAPSHGVAEAQDLAVGVAQDPDTSAVGLTTAEALGPQRTRLRLELEFRRGPRLQWVRHLGGAGFVDAGRVSEVTGRAWLVREA